MTVSSVLNGRAEHVGITQATADRVRAAVQELGYVPNELARSNRLGRRTVVGAMLSDIGMPFVARTLSGIAQGLSAGGLLLKIEDVSGSEQETRALQTFLSHRVAGLAFCNVNPRGDLPRKVQEASRRYSFPYVCTSSSFGPGCHHVGSDDAGGLRQAIRYLAAAGHRSFCYVGINLLAPSPAGRGKAFDSAWEKEGAGLRRRDIRPSRGDAEALSAMRAELQRGRDRPTAFLCGNDIRAAQVIREARHLGLDVPGDLSVMGFGDEGFGSLLDPPLTTIAEPYEQIGTRHAELLLELIANPGRRRTTADERLPTQLVVRASCGPPPPGDARAPRSRQRSRRTEHPAAPLA
jgi:DNA-binding LacI/PurR family transcriptional regulator